MDIEDATLSSSLEIYFALYYVIIVVAHISVHSLVWSEIQILKNHVWHRIHHHSD